MRLKEIQAKNKEINHLWQNNYQMTLYHQGKKHGIGYMNIAIKNKRRYVNCLFKVSNKHYNMRVHPVLIKELLTLYERYGSIQNRFKIDWIPKKFAKQPK